MKTYRPIIKTYTDDYGDQKANASMVESGEHRDKYVPYSDVAPLVEAVRAYESECANPVMDPVLKRKCREAMFSALSTLDADGRTEWGGGYHGASS